MQLDRDTIRSFGNVRFVPTNCYAPKHYAVHHLMFPFDTKAEEETALLEANLADAISRVGEVNGMSALEIAKGLPFIFRMLNSRSEYANTI